MKTVLQSILKAATHLLEQSDRFSADMRDRVNEGVDRAGDQVSGLRDRAGNLYARKDHTVRNVLSFVAGAGVGVGVAVVFAAASGAQVRSAIAERAEAAGKLVRNHFSSPASAATDAERT